MALKAGNSFGLIRLPPFGCQIRLEEAGGHDPSSAPPRYLGGYDEGYFPNARTKRSIRAMPFSMFAMPVA